MCVNTLNLLTFAVLITRATPKAVDLIAAGSTGGLGAVAGNPFNVVKMRCMTAPVNSRYMHAYPYVCTANAIVACAYLYARHVHDPADAPINHSIYMFASPPPSPTPDLALYSTYFCIYIYL